MCRGDGGGQAHGAPDRVGDIWRNELAGLTLTILLYLTGGPDVVRIVHSGEKPLKVKIARTDPERYRELAEPSIQATGQAFAHFTQAERSAIITCGVG